MRLIYLIINVFAVESYVNSKSGGVMMRGEQGLLVRLIPHYKVQVGGTLMRKETWVRQIWQSVFSLSFTYELCLGHTRGQSD